MQTCKACNLQYKRSKKYNHELTNTHLAVNNQNYCNQCKQKIKIYAITKHIHNPMNKNN